MGKSLHAISNWPQYNKSLVNRGSLTFWVDAEAMKNKTITDGGDAAYSTPARPSAPF